MSRRKSVIINPQDRMELKSIAADVFATKIEQHPLVELMKYWLRIFQNEIGSLKERISKLETELELIKRAKLPLQNDNSSHTLGDTEVAEDSKQSVLSPEAIKELRLSVGCNVSQMADIMGIPLKSYIAIERGNKNPPLNFEIQFLKFREMKASERRSVMQDHGIFYCRKINYVPRRIPQPPTEQDIKITRAELDEICEVLHLSHPQLAKIVDATPSQVAFWFYHRGQPGEEHFQKLKQLQKQARNTPAEAPAKKTPKRKNSVSPQQINDILATLEWSVEQLAAYLHVTEYKLRHWMYGDCAPRTLQNNKLLDLLDKIKEQRFTGELITIDEYVALKNVLNFSDFHMAEILKVPYSRARSWTLKVETPSLLDSKKIITLREQVQDGSFIDPIDLPRISADRMSEICKRQRITKKELAKIMRVSNTTLERWLRGAHGPSSEENEKLWMLWEKSIPEPPPILSAEEIVQCRKKLNISQREFGEKLGIPQKRISRLELNLQPATLEISNKIREICGMDIPTAENKTDER